MNNIAIKPALYCQKESCLWFVEGFDPILPQEFLNLVYYLIPEHTEVSSGVAMLPTLI